MQDELQTTIFIGKTCTLLQMRQDLIQEDELELPNDFVFVMNKHRVSTLQNFAEVGPLLLRATPRSAQFLFAGRSALFIFAMGGSWIFAEVAKATSFCHPPPSNIQLKLVSTEEESIQVT